MGQCISTPDQHPAVAEQPKKAQRVGQYLEDGANRCIVEGLSQAYRIVKLLGSGAEASTWLVQDIQTNKPWAIKLIQLPIAARFVQAIFREIKLQSELGEGHQNIIAPEEVVLTSHYLGLVMEFAAGGSLTSYITQRFRECRGIGLLLAEDEARYFFRQLIGAVDFCHRHHVAHRDIKLDNTLLSGHNPPYIKICDFGFARGFGEDSLFSTVIGTPDYMSPQITAAKAQGKALYDGTKADVWALGVLLCVMLIGKFPFEGDSISTVGVNDPMKKVWLQQNKTTWSQNASLKDQLPYLSAEVMDLLNKMFELDEKKRIDIKGIMDHPWYRLPMRKEYTEALDALEAEQRIRDQKLASGIYTSKQRDVAISNIIKLAASEEFRQRATEPITEDTTFQIWTRVDLRSVQSAYPTFNRASLRACMEAHNNNKRLPSGRPGEPNAKQQDRSHHMQDHSHSAAERISEESGIYTVKESVR